MASSAERILSAVNDLAPSLAARAAEIETARRMPPDLVSELKSIGLFRMLAPRSHGGLEVEFPPTVDILAALAAADGATGWTVMIGCETPQLFALLPRASFDTVYAAGPDTICGGAFAPQGKAEAERNGYRVSGRWGFASGCQHADWLFGQCVVLENGAPVPGPMPGAPKLRCMVLPPSQWQILDTWHTAGMRGTGSHDIALSGAHVDEQWSFDLWFGQPCLEGPSFAMPVLQFSMHIGAVALGLAEGAIADLLALADTRKVRLYAKAELADQPLFQYRLGHAETDARAARAFLHSAAASYWAQASAGALDPSLFTRVLSTVAWVVETATRVVDACYQAGGGSALYEKSPLQRRLRDIHTLTQHASVQENVFMTAGAEKLGKPGSFGP
ncbi:MAG: acyl-CoA dehydrogenase family protein [Candidatus Binatia bacterium]